MLYIEENKVCKALIKRNSKCEYQKKKYRDKISVTPFQPNRGYYLGYRVLSVATSHPHPTHLCTTTIINNVEMGKKHHIEQIKRKFCLIKKYKVLYK
jgi:hypothetical protein